VGRLAASGVIVAAVYLLWMFRRVMFGALDKEENRKVTDLTRNEIWVMIPLVIADVLHGLQFGAILEANRQQFGGDFEAYSLVLASTVRHSSGDAAYRSLHPVAENAH
jgi:NADH:ubiquinone oxidoreductase subunit 4 (subunit M)